MDMGAYHLMAAPPNKASQRTELCASGCWKNAFSVMCRAQEEPMNMGAYHHVAPRLKTCMVEERREPPHQIPYAGRPPCASTATGFGKVCNPSSFTIAPQTCRCWP